MRSRQFCIPLGLLATWLSMAATPVAAQTVTGAIVGTVTDATGARVAGASVSATNTLTGETHKTTSNEAGDYFFLVLPVGRYRIEAEMRGFRKFVRDGISLDVNRNARADIRLEVGAMTEEIRVVGDVSLVDTRQVQMGGLVDAQRVNDLPLNGRNVYDLLAILPGVSRTRVQTVPDNEGNFLNVNGSRTRQSTFLLDGGFNNNLWRNSGNEAPNPDAVEEFRLITSNFNAEFGRSPGAVINVVTKSGTSKLHVSLFEFLRNSALNARNFFQPTVAPLRQNQFGASVGGPIRRDKLFFFASYQGLRIRSTSFQNSALTPTAAERGGNFSAAPASQRPVNPATQQAFPGGIVPRSMLDPVATRLLDMLVPLPNTPDGRLQAAAPTTPDNDQGLAKVDYQLTPAHKLYGTLFVVRGSTFDPFFAGTQIPNYAPVNGALNQHNVVVNEDWIVSPSTLNQFRFSYTRRLADNTTSLHTSWQDLGSQLTLGAEPPRPPQFFITGRWQMGTFGDQHFVQQTYGWSDTLTWVRGAHSFKAGGSLLYNHFDETGNWLGAGQIRVTGAFTKNPLADFLLGRAASFRQNNGNNRHFRSKNWAGFIQDDWKAHRKVTLNLGLRYELNPPFISTTDEFQTFRFNRPSVVFPKAPLGLQFPGDPDIPRGVVDTDHKNFAPRFGIAIDPFGNGKTAIRAGYGVFYAIGFASFASDLQGQPFLIDVTAFGTPNFITPWTSVPGGSPFPYVLDRTNPGFSLPITASYFSKSTRTPYVQQYSFTIEQQLQRSLSLQVAYVGSTSRKLYMQRDANAPIFIPGRSTAANVNARRPYLPGTFAEIALTETASNAHYDSLQITLNRRFSRGFSLLANYVLSKAIDEISDDKFNPQIVALVDSNNRRLDRAVSDIDTRHILNVSYVWELPDTQRWGFVGRQILSGWQCNGIVRVQSGRPFTVFSGRDSNLDGNNNDRPDLIGNPMLDTSRARDPLIARYFNPAAFRAAPDGANGTAGRNLLYGPGAMDWDVSFFKSFVIQERHHVQFRAEFFNFFNQVNLGSPNSTLTSPNVGRILSAGPARVIQFGLKYAF